nr:transglycosylase domain-containing protein [Saprospiraceae bacterium]
MFLPKIFAHSSAALVAILGIWFWFCLPEPLFDRPLAKELLDRQGQLIGGQVAVDGQWRFEGPDSIPVKFKTCLVQFEDQRFYHHPGIDVFALFRALKQNVHARKVVSGGSTLTMQV